MHRWFSDNPDKARAERFFLLYSPVWIAAVAFVMLSGVMSSWGDGAYMAFAALVAAPLLLVPALTWRDAETAQLRPLYERYWFKFNLWIAIYVFAGSYVGTHYFFDVLGMRYAFPTTWNLDAALVGRDSGDVPLFLYVLTQCYFVTYHVILVVLLRRYRTGSFGQTVLGRALTPVALLAIAYGVAYGETYFMASEALSDYFWYLDRERMLSLGSLFYATYFVVSTPLVYGLDERAEQAGEWSLGRVAVSALAASMLMFYVLDLWAMVFGPIIEG